MSYQPEERYWTDYLRIALPVVGLLLMLGLFWFWANSLIGDSSDNEPAATATVAVAITTVAASTATPTVAGTVPAVVPTTQPPPASVPPTTAGGADEPDETAEPEETDAGFAVDAVVYTTDGVNFRNAPSTAEGTLITELPVGTQLTVIGAPEEGADLTWYPVVAEDGTQGYVAEQFLSADPPA
ncbi:MAG: hypothetical protein AVDCRST_MAG73-679 [uncultured Thermomicrobiales bacterium]|uniref:SH3b domain-containing protein n=1 Tax=uncultured Thermomicrobiales bacterium TaxID=1645740 RepID=A0A6J4TN96_9BACT|nr:MAG: hypothetical protein AVDCRST_MAG73-679 [uncultured Thermomicrobiales bacterium]